MRLKDRRAVGVAVAGAYAGTFKSTANVKESEYKFIVVEYSTLTVMVATYTPQGPGWQ